MKDLLKKEAAAVNRDSEFREDIIGAVRRDFEERRTERRPFELQWRLNMNYLAGNQYTYIGGRGEIEENERNYFWQQREVFNHLAPIIDSRISKLGRVRPKMAVTPATGDEADLYTAKLSTEILESAYSKLDMDEIISRATMWSEVCGTSFYKLSWDKLSGRELSGGAERVFEGDVRVDVCTPFEIFPDNSFAAGLDAVQSIIHARAVPVQYILDTWGAEVEPETVEVSAADYGFGGGMGYIAGLPAVSKTRGANLALLIEKYERPTGKYPCGRLIIIAGDKLLYYGELPYVNGHDGTRDFPFVRQLALERAGCFWGVSVLERAIPIQRAYNAVKNRKHEFLNRISVGVLAVEDGSVDTDNLEEEGLSPGKILVYRQGSNPPSVLNIDRLPSEFNYEEDRLMNEFIMITGVSEMMRNSGVPSQVTSGVALQLLIEQDDTRISISAGLIRRAVKDIGRHIIRLYKQYAGQMRISRVVGENGSVEVVYWSSSDVSDNDIVFTTENEISTTPAAKRTLIFDLLKAGLLIDASGGMSDHTRVKVLELLGLGAWDESQDLSGLHIRRAAKENLKLTTEEIAVGDIDDHRLHIAEHTRYMLSGDYEANCNEQAHARFSAHVNAHRAALEAAAVKN